MSALARGYGFIQNKYVGIQLCRRGGNRVEYSKECKKNEEM